MIILTKGEEYPDFATLSTASAVSSAVPIQAECAISVPERHEELEVIAVRVQGGQGSARAHLRNLVISGHELDGQAARTADAIARARAQVDIDSTKLCDDKRWQC